MGYWKTKVLPKIKKVFEKNGNKKAAAEATKSFDDSKEEINKEFEEKKAELQPKVTEIYEASSTEIKTLVKEPKEAGLKQHSIEVQKFLEELVKIEFPGSKLVTEASSKYGAALIPGPIFFVFEKVSTFIVTEEKPSEEEATAAVAAAAPEPTPEGETKPAGEETSEKKEKEIEVEVVAEEKTEPAATAVEEKTEPPPAAAAEEKTKPPATAPPAPTEPAKEEPPKA